MHNSKLKNIFPFEIFTPYIACKYIHSFLNLDLDNNNHCIIDLCCGSAGMLLSNINDYYDKNIKYIGYDKNKSLCEFDDLFYNKFNKIYNFEIIHLDVLKSEDKIQQKINLIRNEMKDVKIHIIMNPPYQDSSNNASNNKLWTEFITLAINLKNIEDVIVIHPDWQSISSLKFLNEINKKHFVESIKFLDQKVFNVGCDISISKIILNKKYTENDLTKFINEDDEAEFINISNVKNCKLRDYQKQLSRILSEKIVDNLTVQYPNLHLQKFLNEGNWTPKIMKCIHKEKDISTISNLTITYYDSGNTKSLILENEMEELFKSKNVTKEEFLKNNGVPKLIFSFSSSHKSSGKVFKTTDICGSLNHWSDIIYDDMFEVYKYVYEHKLFKFLMNNYNKTSGWNAYIKNKKLPLFYSKQEVDNYINFIYSNLTQDEINLIDITD